jgi:hypothetical protein
MIQEDFAEGSKFTTTSHSTFIYVPGGQIVRVLGSFMSTRTDTNFLALAAAPDQSLTEEWQWGPADQWTWSDTQHNFDIGPGDSNWPSTVLYADNLYVAWQRTTAEVTIAPRAIIWWGNLVVVHRRYNYAGGDVNLTGDFTLTVQGLVHDLMGRGFNRTVEFLPDRVDPGTPWTTVVPHAAWPSGVSAREVLAYAEQFAPGMWWQILEPGLSGLPRFVVGRWDGPIRYVLTPSNSKVELAGGGGDLANRCLVRYVGSAVGQSKAVWVAEVRANVRGLAEAGVIRTMQLDLTSEGLMSATDARLRGVAALRNAAIAKTAGKATISGPIYDFVEGRMVEPWEVQDGSPVLAASASSTRAGSLSESVAADGTSVFRARSVSYDASSNAATLSLDGGSRSLIGRFKAEATQRRYDLATVRG